MLFDGTVTLAESEIGLGGEIELTDVLTVGGTYDVEINGHSFNGIAKDGGDGSIMLEASCEDSGAFVQAADGITMFFCSPDVGSVGENTLKIEEAVYPRLYDGNVELSESGGMYEITGLNLDGTFVAGDKIAFVINDNADYGIASNLGDSISVKIPDPDDPTIVFENNGGTITFACASPVAHAGTNTLTITNLGSCS